MDTGQWKGEGREGRKGGRVDGDGGARFLSSDTRAIFSIREINMSNDFDLNRVPFPLICLMGEVAGYAGWGEGRRGYAIYHDFNCPLTRAQHPLVIRTNIRLRLENCDDSFVESLWFYLYPPPPPFVKQFSRTIWFNTKRSLFQSTSIFRILSWIVS